MKEMSILLVDDHIVAREGVKYILHQSDEYKFYIDECGTGRKAIELANKKKYDLVIMDLSMPETDGVKASRLILQNKSDQNILALSLPEEDELILQALKNGVLGIVLKTTKSEELIQAIISVSKGNKFYSNDVSTKLMMGCRDQLQGKSSKPKVEPVINVLSNREIQVLQLIANEYTNEEIALELNISKRTVDSHRQNLINKLKVKNTIGLLKYAIDQNVI